MNEKKEMKLEAELSHPLGYQQVGGELVQGLQLIPTP